MWQKVLFQWYEFGLILCWHLKTAKLLIFRIKLCRFLFNQLKSPNKDNFINKNYFCVDLILAIIQLKNVYFIKMCLGLQNRVKYNNFQNRERLRSYHQAKFAKIWIFLLCTFKNSNFHNFCWVIRTQPISVLKLFLLYYKGSLLAKYV